MHYNHEFDTPFLGAFLTLLFNIFEWLNIAPGDMRHQVFMSVLGATVAFFITMGLKKLQKKFIQWRISKKKQP